MLELSVPYLSWKTVPAIIIILVTLRSILRHVAQERAIRALGMRAPKVKSLPLGIDIMIRAFFYHINFRDPQFWNFLLSHRKNPHSYTVETNLCGQRVVFTADPDNIRAILASQFADFGKGEGFRHDWHILLGNSVFSMDGQKWHDARQLLRPQFTKVRLTDLIIFEKYVQVLLRGLAGGDAAIMDSSQIWKGKGEQVDLTSLIHRYTLDTSTDFLFGKSVGSLQNPDDTFAEAFEAVQRTLSTMARAGPAKRLFQTKALQLHADKIDSVAYGYIDDALALSPEQQKPDASATGHTFLHALTSVSRDRVFLRDQIVSLLLAGRDTTAAIFIWIFYELARNPECYAKLRREVLEAVGPHNTPTYGDLKAMKYLQNTMNESMRLYPLPFNIRTTLKDTTLPRGGGADGNLPVAVLKGTPIGFSTLNLHRREDLFSDVADGFPPSTVFCPERWEKWYPKPWTFVPFSGGPRICLGQPFALAQMGYTIARVAQTFEKIQLLEELEEDQVRSDVMLEPLKHLKLAFWESVDSTMKT